MSLSLSLFIHLYILLFWWRHEKGESVSHFVDDVGGNDRLKSALAHIGAHALLKMLLVDNFIHADMRPGNILVRVSHSRLPNKGLFKSRPHVVFVDVGMTADLSSGDRVNLLEFFKAVALGDGRTAAQCTLRLSKQQNCPNPKAFIEKWKSRLHFGALLKVILSIQQGACINCLSKFGGIKSIFRWQCLHCDGNYTGSRGLATKARPRL